MSEFLITDLLSNYCPTMEDFHRLFQEFFNLLYVQNVFTTTYLPHTYGKLERYNRTILTALQFFLSYHPRYWDLYTSGIRKISTKYSGVRRNKFQKQITSSSADIIIGKKIEGISKRRKPLVHTRLFKYNLSRLWSNSLNWLISRSPLTAWRQPQNHSM